MILFDGNNSLEIFREMMSNKVLLLFSPPKSF